MAMAPISLEILRLQDRCFTTAPDDTSTLGSLAIELQRAQDRVEVASRSGLLTPLEATACASFASNIVNLSSCVVNSSYAIEDLCDEFSKKSNIFSLNLGRGAILSKPSSATVSCTHTIRLNHHGLKKWCRSNLSYLFPSNTQMVELSAALDMSESQVNSWFRNARTRSGWSKLFSDKINVNRDPSRLSIVFHEYQSYILSHCQSDIQEKLSSDKQYRLVDKVWHWFQADRKCKKPEESGAVKPWVKTVLFEALEKANESYTSNFKSKEARPFCGFGEPLKMMDQAVFPHPPSDIEETASESSSSTNSRCSTLSFSPCESASGSSSDQPMSSNSTSNYITTPSSTLSEFLPSSSSSSFQPSSPSLVSLDLFTPVSHVYPSPPDLICPHPSGPPRVLTSQPSNPVETINGLDALFQLNYSSCSPDKFPPPQCEFLEAPTLPSDFILDSLRDFALPSSSSTNSRKNADFESGQFDDACED